MSVRELRRRIRERRKKATQESEKPDFTGFETDSDTTEAPIEPALIEPTRTDAERDAFTAAEQRCPAFATQLRSLDPWQLHAVLAAPTCAIVQAQVGSGKTTVLVHKVLFLHLIRGVPLRQMAVLAFTNKAAAEFRQRVSAMLRQVGVLTPTDSDAMRWFGTFHSLARTLLRHDLPVKELGYGTDFRVMDTAEQWALWQRLILSNGLNIKHQSRLSRRMELLQEGQVRFGNMRKDDAIVELAELAAAEKLALGLMNFDDLLANAHALLASHRIAQPPAWLIVDELQDCDMDQLDLIDALADETTHRFYVGDPNQVIYSWRGSAPQLFAHLRAQHDTDTFVLPMNYRSTATIVHAARSFLRGSGRLDEASKDTSALVASRPAGEPLAVVTCQDPRAEAAWLVEQVQALLAQGAAAKTIAVLARTRRRLDTVRDLLTAAQIPVAEQANGTTAGVGEAAKLTMKQCDLALWLLHLLRGGLHGGDYSSAAIALSHRDFGLATARDVAARDRQDRKDVEKIRTGNGLLPLLAQLKKPKRGRQRRGSDRALAATIVSRLMELPDLIAGTADVTTLTAHLLLSTQLGPTLPLYEQRMALVTTWLTGLLHNDPTPTQFGERIDVAMRNPQTMHSQALRLQSNVSAGDENTAHGALAWPLKGQSVQLLTMHAAKGLEWDTVFLIGINAGAIPLPMAMRDPAQLSEERRLFFVAMTRARERLILSWCRRPDDPRQQELSSPFIRLLPDAVTEHHDHPAALFAKESSVKDEKHGDCVEKSESTAEVTAELDWQVGQRVLHKRYGVGELIEVTDVNVTCAFERRGTKRFSRAMCPLRAVPTVQ